MELPEQANGEARGGGFANEFQGFGLRAAAAGCIAAAMSARRTGEIAVIFLSRRTAADDSGYAAAAAAMEALAARQPGYRGIDSVRGTDGAGITVSWWADEASALAWRAEATHAATRELGRALWYESYEVAVAQVVRSYQWER